MRSNPCEWYKIHTYIYRRDRGEMRWSLSRRAGIHSDDSMEKRFDRFWIGIGDNTPSRYTFRAFSQWRRRVTIADNAMITIGKFYGCVARQEITPDRSG